MAASGDIGGACLHRRLHCALNDLGPSIMQWKSLADIDLWNYHNSMTTKKLTGRGGPGRGQGRKPVETSNAMLPVSIKMTAEQKEKLQQLGGAPWVRDKIDRAKVPAKE